MSTVTYVETGLEGVYASAPEPLPFGRSLSIRAFLLRREQGNLAVYSTPTASFDGLPVERQYLNHWHEAIFPTDRLEAPLFVHEDDHAQTARRTEVAGTFSGRQTLDADFELIPIPGHTPGATAYLWDSGEDRLLFTGDTVYLSDGEWVAAVLDSSDRAAYITSLELIRELEFDVLVPWAATADQPYYAVTDEVDSQRRIDAILERLRRGKSY